MNDPNDPSTNQRRLYGDDLAPPDYTDAVIEAYMKDVDRTLLRENLKLTVEQRLLNFESFMRDILELREAGRKSRGER